MKPDYAFKASVIGSGLDTIERQVSKTFFCYSGYASLLDYELKAPLDYETAKALNAYMQEDCPLEWKEAHKINDARYHRTSRLKARVARLIERPSVFLTFTFTDDVIGRTTADTRRQRVIRLLKSFGVPYIANIDFGARNHREHYHALLQVPSIDCKAVINQYGYGAIKCEKVRSADDNVKLAKYISKLSNHAIKETTKRNAIIYSR